MTKKSSILVLTLVGILIAASVYLISKLQFSYDFEDFFPHDDPQTGFYFNFRDAFETDNDFFIIALENKAGIYNYDFLQKVDSLNAELKRLPYVQEAIGPTRINEYYRDPFLGQVFTVPLLRWQEPENYAKDSLKVLNTPGMVGLFFSEKGSSVAINLKHDENLSKRKCDELAAAIESTVGKFNFDETHIIGRALGQRLYVETMLKELIMFISLSLVITIIFLLIAFRSFWGVAVPTFIVLVSILFTLGFVKLIGKDLDLMMTVLPTIIFVVGMSDSVHVLTKYMQELRAGRDRIEAIKYAFRSIRLATFLTALTTSIGFITLVFSNIRPISDFAIYTSFGIMMAYGLTYTVMPAVLFLAKPKGLYINAEKEDFWSKYLHRWLSWIIRNRKGIAIGMGVIIVLSIYSITRIPVDNYMLEDLRDSHHLKKEFRYMEENFSGCRPFEMAIMPAQETDVFSADFLKDMDTIGHFLQQKYGVGSMMSLSELVKSSNKALNAGQQSYFIVPEDSSELKKIEKFANRKEVARLTSLNYNKEANVLRISGKTPDLGRRHYAELNKELDAFIAQSTTTKFEYKVTGTAQLIDLNNQYLVENMVWDLLLSIAAIGLVMGLVYKSWKMILLTIIPNIIPLVIVGGIMGLTGIPLKVSTSIIFNIAFGIAVDDTIHFLARVRSFLLEGKSSLYAVKRTFLTTGKAMIVTTLILSGGFLTLILSDFLGTFYIGFLISLTLFIALIAELLISPLVVMMFYRKK
jgi:predicted RND superfamily exporter protein